MPEGPLPITGILARPQLLIRRSWRADRHGRAGEGGEPGTHHREGAAIRAVLLNEPDTSDPVRPDVAALYLTSNEDYRRAAREATQAYAV